MKIEVARYRKADGYATRYWSVMVNGELLVVTVYRKGAEAVANALANPLPHDPPAIVADAPNPDTNTEYSAAGMVSHPAE